MNEKLWPQWTHAGRLEWWIVLVQVLVAGIILAPALAHLGTALPGQSGMADLPGTVNFHWLVHTQSFSELRQSTMLMYPSEMERLLLDGMPLDALASWPFAALFGWPGGFSIFQWVSMAALGTGSAWLARGWWGNAGAAAIAGIVAQTQPFLIREFINGRPTQVFGAIFLPLCLGYTLRAFSRHSKKDALLAGVCWGLGTVAYWYYGAFFGLSVLCILACLAWSKDIHLPTIGALFAGLVAITAVPMAYVLRGETKIPGQGSTWDDLITHGSNTMRLRQVIEHRDLGANMLTDRVLALQIIAILLMVLVIKTYRRRRWLIPIMWAGLSVLFAMGPQISLGFFDIAGPFALFELTELTARNWWPDRALVMLGPATALLVAGGAMVALERWTPHTKIWTFGAMGALLLEAFIAIPGLPIPVTWGAPSPQSQVLQEGAGPVLILPVGSGGRQPDARMLIDQIQHQRPLINGPMPHSSSTAPAEYRKRMRSIALAPFIVCESNPSALKMPKTEQIISALRELDLNEIYLDTALAQRFMRDADVYRQCVEGILQIDGKTEGPFLVFALDSDSGRDGNGDFGGIP